ncbi:YaaA family protein [Nesterenkonia flava]|uniref:Peroxide stress protein YaaA n=1 Tax=Nesterenkonia flava TaxID=469799 RepID=A0ABU1FUP1_9MICC|nr:peroxide stress protein YaaA [Nesterenkonia flava]MDR5712385.1 peroxide stress protein YaaA [Nesterenkonia flava]
MLIFLPPSEGKTAPDDDGSRLELTDLFLPELAPERDAVMEALISVSASEDAQAVLKVGAKVMGEVRANTGLRQAPTAPAWQVYTGVLFDALQAETLSRAQLQRAASQVFVFSGLFGLTGLADRIPAYRLSMDVSLPPHGRLGTFWKKALEAPLSETVGDQLVVDCRSATYAGAFRAPAQQTLMVNNFTEKDGVRKVVTHFAKHARGELAGMLLRATTPPETIDDVVAVASQRWRVEVRPAQKSSPHHLDLISEGC